MLPLHCALSSKAQMDVITLVVDKSPSSLSATDSKRQLPVHVAFSLYAGTGESIADLIRLLMGTRPHVVLWGRNKATRLALSVAIQKRVSAEVIELLLEYSPSNILTTSVRRGKAHLFWQSNRLLPGR